MGRILFAVFLLVPLIEIAFFVMIGNAIGLWPTLAGVLVTAVIGSLILRWQGLQLFNEIRSTMGAGRLPARALADAMMVGDRRRAAADAGLFHRPDRHPAADPAGPHADLPLPREPGAGRFDHDQRSSYGFGPRRVEDDTIELGDDEYRPRKQPCRWPTSLSGCGKDASQPPGIVFFS